MLRCHLQTVVVLLLTAASAFAGEPPRIGRVTVTPLDIFTREEAARGWAYRTTNRLHVQTREEVIRRFLLFAEGDTFDPEKLAETERNLRRLDFVKSATITASAPHDGVVDVTVVTQDSWTTEVTVNANSEGGAASWGFELTESNLLGRGKQLSLIYDNDVDRTRKGLNYRDPSFLRPYWNSELLLTDNSDGSQQKVAVKRPFFAFDTAWGVEILANRFDKTTKLYRDSFVDSEFQVDEREVTLAWGRAIAPSMQRAHRLLGGVDWIDDHFERRVEDPDAVLPEARDFHYLFGRYEYVENGFIKINYVNRDLRFEDINLGRQFALQLGVSPEALGLDTTTGMARLSVSEGHLFTDQVFLLASARFDTRFGGGTNRNAIARADVHFVRKFATARPQTFVGRLHADRGWDLDRDVQFFADGDTGLRAYRLNAFEGDKTVILNLEHRIFLARELWQVISPGAAIFIDTGAATPNGEPLSFGDFRTDVGVGLRIGIARTTRNMLRLDLAYAVDEDPRGERGFLISFSSAQAF
ncbi:MAG: POTRA domain-containing protein [Thermoanaerobaculia bacterium]